MPSAPVNGETVKPTQAGNHYELNLQASIKTLGEPRKMGGSVLALVLALVFAVSVLAGCYIRYIASDYAEVEAELRMKMSRHV